MPEVARRSGLRDGGEGRLSPKAERNRSPRALGLRLRERQRVRHPLDGSDAILSSHLDGRLLLRAWSGPSPRPKQRNFPFLRRVIPRTIHRPPYSQSGLVQRRAPLVFGVASVDSEFLICASMFWNGFERTMLSRIRRQPLATQFFRACGRLMLAQKLRGRSQAEAHFRRRRELYLCRSADPAG